MMDLGKVERYFHGGPGQDVRLWILLAEAELKLLQIQDDTEQANYVWQGLVGDAWEFYCNLSIEEQWSWCLIKKALLEEFSWQEVDNMKIRNQEEVSGYTGGDDMDSEEEFDEDDDWSDASTITIDVEDLGLSHK